MQLIEDYMAFRGVCTSWRSAARVDDFLKSWPPVPLIIVAEDIGDLKLYSLFRGKIWRRMPLPEAEGKKCIESRGWLITISRSGDMSLLHPHSRAQIELPNQSKFPLRQFNDYPFLNVIRAVLSASPSETSDFVVVVVGGAGLFLSLWRPGDTTWTTIGTQIGVYFSQATYYKEKIYAISYGGHIWVWDLLDPPVAQYFCAVSRELINFRQTRLMESAGELLIVASNGALSVNNFLVMQMDLIKRGWKKVGNLGDMAIFVGHGAAFSMDATIFPRIVKPNCIYFTDDGIEAWGMGRTWVSTMLKMDRLKSLNTFMYQFG